MKQGIFNVLLVGLVAMVLSLLSTRHFINEQKALVKQQALSIKAKARTASKKSIPIKQRGLSRFHPPMKATEGTK